jgi:hypothetical protein
VLSALLHLFPCRFNLKFACIWNHWQNRVAWMAMRRRNIDSILVGPGCYLVGSLGRTSRLIFVVPAKNSVATTEQALQEPNLAVDPCIDCIEAAHGIQLSSIFWLFVCHAKSTR